MEDLTTDAKKGVVLSGMRPTGDLHIGHFEAVLRNWTRLQETHGCFYFVADWHAITTDTNTKQIKEHSIDMVKDWLAFGVDPKKSTVFVQSLVPAHAELSLALERIVNIGTLRRLPTFKGYLEHIAGDRSRYDKDKNKLSGEARLDAFANAEVSVGFLTYPVLQAADILLYDATDVPVGEDQLPHIELTREIARKFNSTYGEAFTIPEAMLDADIVMIRGRDGRKMSKSYGNHISPDHTEEEIYERVKSFVTDRKKLSDEGDPYECPVFDLHRAFNRDGEVEVARACRNATSKCYDCKTGELPDLIADSYSDYRTRKAEISDGFVLDVLREGNIKAREVTSEKMDQVRKFMLMDYLK
ncbi:tryptophan--tRNA ligase [Candidatus Woesearchaeota archaeon]|nr:tryptophan--tRNA ligase [Candidatus Woesearchaeota archaeon]